MTRKCSLFLIVSALWACDSPPVETPDGAPPPACHAPTTGPTQHSGSISADETWTADGSPHVVPSGVSINAEVTIEPCSVVQLGADVTVTVGLNGSIVGEGTAERPIAVTAVDATKPWATVRAIGGRIRLAHAVVEDGGRPPPNVAPYRFAAFMAQRGSDPRAPVAALSFEHVTINRSRSNGVDLSVSTFDPASDVLIVTGSAEYPVRMTASALGTLPIGTYTGNAHDEILVPGGLVPGSEITVDTTIRDRGVPYHIGDASSTAELRVGTSPGDPVATLTIDSNVTLRFESGGILSVEHFTGTGAASGALIARGTDGPIVFTSAAASPAPGDWVGIVFGSTPDPSDELYNVRIEYAGFLTGTIGASCEPGEAQAALQIVGGRPASGFLAGSTIRASAKDGVYRGWMGDEVDFGATNTFDAVPGCTQTFPRPLLGGCPQDPPCPK